MYNIAKKTIIYRLVASVYALTIAYIITRDVSFAITWSFLDTFGKMLLYGAFEWSWERPRRKRK